MFNKLKYKTIKAALKFVGIELTDSGCSQLLIICMELQKLIDIIKKEK